MLNVKREKERKRSEGEREESVDEEECGDAYWALCETRAISG
jgi:hypothetical protein